MAAKFGSVKGIVALVTGGGSGLGRATVDMFLREGARGVVCMDLKKPADLQSDNLHLVEGSVVSEEDVKRALEETQSKFGQLNAVVNCAGVGVAQLTYHGLKKIPHSLDDFKRVMEVNAIGSFNVARLAMSLLVKNEPDHAQQKGVIINTASIAAFEGQIGQVAYAASKGAIVSMTLPMARDVATFGVRVMTIAPGLFDTPLLRSLPKNVIDSLVERVPCPKRLGDPDEYAHLVKAIVENPMLNGSVIRLDGSLRMEP